MRTTSPWARVTAKRDNRDAKTSQSLRKGNAEYQAPREVVQRNLATMNTDVVVGPLCHRSALGRDLLQKPLNGKSCAYHP